MVHKAKTFMFQMGPGPNKHQFIWILWAWRVWIVPGEMLGCSLWVMRVIAGYFLTALATIFLIKYFILFSSALQVKGLMRRGLQYKDNWNIVFTLKDFTVFGKGRCRNTTGNYIGKYYAAINTDSVGGHVRGHQLRGEFSGKAFQKRQYFWYFFSSFGVIIDVI